MEKPDRYLKLDDVLEIIDEMIAEQEANAKAWEDEYANQQDAGDERKATNAWKNAMKHFCIARTLEKLRYRLD